MALGDNYITLDQLKLRLGIDDTVDDEILTGVISTASRSVEKYCSRQFNLAGTATSRIFYQTNIVEVNVDDFATTTSLVVKTDPAGDGSFGQTWSVSDYQLEPLNQTVDGVPNYPYNRITAVAGRLFLFPQLFYSVRRAPVQVTAFWGWPEVPDAVTQATLILAEELAKLKDAPYGIAGFADFGAIRVRENPKVGLLLNPYMRSGVMVG